MTSFSYSSCRNPHSTLNYHTNIKSAISWRKIGIIYWGCNTDLNRGKWKFLTLQTKCLKVKKLPSIQSENNGSLLNHIVHTQEISHTSSI